MLDVLVALIVFGVVGYAGFRVGFVTAVNGTLIGEMDERLLDLERVQAEIVEDLFQAEVSS